jgi:hypothetical protein
VSQLIEIGGKRRDRRLAAQAGVLGAKARFYDAKRTLDQGVTKAYIAALLAAENARVLSESADFARQEARIADARFKAGDLSEADKETLEINAEQFELQAKSAAAAALQARIAVEVLMGVNQPLGNWLPVDSLEKLTEVSPQESAPEAKAGVARPDVLAAETDLRNAQAQLRLQKASTTLPVAARQKIPCWWAFRSPCRCGTKTAAISNRRRPPSRNRKARWEKSERRRWLTWRTRNPLIERPMIVGCSIAMKPRPNPLKSARP